MAVSACTMNDGYLHVDVFWCQSEIVQVVVLKRVSVGVQTGREVTAGHGDTHHSVANTCHKTRQYNRGWGINQCYYSTIKARKKKVRQSL